MQLFGTDGVRGKIEIIDNEYEEGELIISPWGYANLSFSITDESVISTTIGFNIWPIHHDYALKELMFSIVEFHPSTSSYTGLISSKLCINSL